jgi:hypothetical protein
MARAQTASTAAATVAAAADAKAGTAAALANAKASTPAAKAPTPELQIFKMLRVVATPKENIDNLAMLPVLKEVITTELALLTKMFAVWRPRLDADVRRNVQNYLSSLEKLAALRVDVGLWAAAETFDVDQQLAHDCVVEMRRLSSEESSAAVRMAQAKELASAGGKSFQRIQTAHARAKSNARDTVPVHGADGKRVQNMVCTVINLETGAFAEGRAGHGRGHAAFETLLATELNTGKPGAAVKINRIAANAQVVENTVNCAEWDALWQLYATERPRSWSVLYFASAVPGQHGGLIPPCKNCERLMAFLGASAYGFKPGSKTRNVG